MIWILRDGDEQIGMHYDLGMLLDYCGAHEPKEEYHLEISCYSGITEEQINNAYI